ncbi:SDR family NAD(P)-dependent oxidoreductase [bacterium]|nr:SDR family NAD(P)-dependent oxidoreductase [bacterium]NBX82200.1 SDR family NAD(P)-dependent oxidoreductase [bacterium]
MKESISGKTVFVTGADGFIGSHLVEALVRAGARVKALIFYNSWGQKGWLNDVAPEILSHVECIPGDIRDAEFVRKVVDGCEYVFHLASLIAIPYSYLAARSYIDTNIGGTLNVLQACLNNNRLVRLLHVSTSEVYGTAQTVPIKESHPLVGQSPYSASKIGADKIAESFHLSFGLPLVTARPFNTFGPRQTARAVIPTIASQLISGCGILKLGALSPTRDFNYVTDTTNGMVDLGLCREAEGKVVNIGTGEEWSIETTAKLLMQIVGREVEIQTEESRIRPEKSEVNRLLADNQLLSSLTSWQPQVPFEEGLKRTVSWISKNIQCFEPEKYNR